MQTGTLAESAIEPQHLNSASFYGFSATKATNQSLAGPGTTTILFDNVEYNDGNAYDKTTGKFTAPVSGMYSFTARLVTVDNTGGQEARIGLYRYRGSNVTEVRSGESILGANFPSSLQLATEVPLLAGDSVVIGLLLSAAPRTLDSTKSCYFTGSLKYLTS